MGGAGDNCRDSARCPGMPKVNQSVVIDIEQLRVGMFIELDMGWMNHPFPVSSFRLSSLGQIHVLRMMGLKQVRYVPARSSSLWVRKMIANPSLKKRQAADIFWLDSEGERKQASP